MLSGRFIPTLQCNGMTLNMLESSTNFGFDDLRFCIFTDSWVGGNRFEASGNSGFHTGFSGISGVSGFL